MGINQTSIQIQMLFTVWITPKQVEAGRNTKKQCWNVGVIINQSGNRVREEAAYKNEEGRGENSTQVEDRRVITQVRNREHKTH